MNIIISSQLYSILSIMYDSYKFIIALAFIYMLIVAGGRNLNVLLAEIFLAQSELSPSSILILLSGAPSESEETLQLMLEASRSSTVRLSFVQVGDDPSAKEWLESLARHTELRRIVDVTTLASMRNTWLSEKVDFLFEYTTGY